MTRGTRLDFADDDQTTDQPRRPVVMVVLDDKLVSTPSLYHIIPLEDTGEEEVSV